MDLDLLDPEGMGPFIRHLGLTITEATGSRVEATWTADERHHQPFGLVHGGVHASVVETLASVGANLWFADRGHCVGVNNNTDMFTAVRQGPLTSVAEPVHQGGSQQVWVVETRDNRNRLVARGQLRLHNLRAP